MEQYETAIRGGTVVDGSGSEPYIADLGISGGRIREIGKYVRGQSEIDATGLLVTPGFIDLHTHFDAQVFWDPALTPSSMHGVTTVASGSCGFSLAPCREEMRDFMLRTLHYVEDMDPATLKAGVQWGWETFSEYLSVITANKTIINFGAYIGHTAVRLFVMGEEAYERHATAEEISEMCSVVRAAVLGGALGFATDRSPFHRGIGGRRVPSTIGTDDEVYALFDVLRQLDRGTGMAIVDPLNFEWVFEIQCKINRPFNWCQMMTYPENSQWHGSSKRQMEIQSEAAAQGHQIFGQATSKPVTAQLTFENPVTFFSLPSFSEVAAIENQADRRSLYTNDEWRSRARHDFDSGNVGTRWEKVVVAETASNASKIGMTVAQLAAAQGRHPLDVALDISLSDDLHTRFTLIAANDDREELATILTTDGCVLGLSDAGAHCDQMCDANMLTDFLAHWVRDEGLMSVERGVQKMTQEPARVLGIERDRGTISEGMAADIVAFDLKELDPGSVRRVSDFPLGMSRLTADDPSGFYHVLVNGTPIQLDGVPLDIGPEHRPGVLIGS
jgi:N-acyl-D-amino-acid deacylase